MTTDKTPTVQLTNGERLAYPEQRTDGVMTDAGLIPWDEVAGFWAHCRCIEEMVFIPLA